MRDDLIFRLQSQVEQLEALVLSLKSGGDSAGGAAAALAVTFKEGTTYPTSPNAVYAAHVAVPGGTETEGSTGSVTAGSAVIHVVNVGTAAPPIGTNLLVFSVGSRWVAQYDG